MANGKTVALRNIRIPAPVWIHRHVGANRETRRHHLKTWKGSYMRNEPYEYPARDDRKGRKLR